MNIDDIADLTLPRLREIAKERKIKGVSLLRKKEMVEVIKESFEKEERDKKKQKKTPEKKIPEKKVSKQIFPEKTFPEKGLTEDPEDEVREDEVQPESVNNDEEMEEKEGISSELPKDLRTAKQMSYQEQIDSSSVVDSPLEEAEGMLDIMNDGFGFLRREKYKFSDNDIYISASQISRFKLRQADMVAGLVRKPKEHERYSAIARIESINNQDPEKSRNRPIFRNLTPIHPIEQFKLETESDKYSTRIMDLLIPVGKGQRGLLVSPPKAGKTVILKELANSISKNYPETELIILLIDERPEEVTDMKRSVNADVVSSTFDEKPENHIRVTEMAWERALRMVEYGKDVVVLMDSITRLTRGYNLVIPPSGRTLSGGIDPGAFYKPKRFFGAARKVEEGGSLTIIATALVETGSRMDDVIYEEFKGTGNMELHLDRKIADRRIFPAIDVTRSGTRREELLIDEATIELMWALRRAMSNSTSSEFLDTLFSKLKQTKSNADFLENMHSL